MQLTPTKYSVQVHRRSPRGAAEIELLLVTMFILIPVLFLTGAMLTLGPARILNPFHANQEAYQDAIAAGTPGSVPDVQLIPEDATLDPAVETLQGMDQMHQATSSKDVTVTLGKWTTLPTVTLTDSSEFTSPAWAYSSWPAPGDDGHLQDWVQAYASESFEQTLPSGSTAKDALELQEAWPP